MSEVQHQGDAAAFAANWQTRQEKFYTHWTRERPKNQIQLAFRNHWEVFQMLLGKVGLSHPLRVLEVGCGRGTLSCYFADAGHTCTLADLSLEAISVARSIFATHGLPASFDVEDAVALSYPSESFDLTFSIGLLEHFEDVRKPVVEQVRVLRRGGLFIGYVVPHYTNNVQQEYHWINEVLEGYAPAAVDETSRKSPVFRSNFGSDHYLPILREAGLSDIQSSGIYPLPMISHSIEFPFSLMPPTSEAALLAHFEEILRDRAESGREHPWLCPEGFGQAFLIWGIKR